MVSGPYYETVAFWSKHYGHGEVEDKRSVHLFMDCETDERVKTLRAQLYSISSGRFDQATLDKQLGQARRLRHGSYDNWAKLMLQWMAEHKG